jgi:hypothetical protein
MLPHAGRIKTLPILGFHGEYLETPCTHPNESGHAISNKSGDKGFHLN